MKSISPSPVSEKKPKEFNATVDRIIQYVFERKYCAVLGPRFSGKTDLLNAVREELEHSSRTVVRVNLFEVDATKPSDFFNSLAKIIYQQLANQSRNSKAIAVSVSDSSTFRSFIQDVIDHINNEFVLIIDHLEGISNDLVRLLLTSLRAIYMEQQSNNEHRLVVIVAGALSLAGVATGETSPFRGIAELVIIDLPSDEESEKYIKTFFSNLDIRLSSAVLKYLISAARGDRYLIEFLCNKCAQLISEKNPKQLSVPLVEKISQEFILNEAQSHAPLQEAVRLIENDPDLLVCTLLLIKKSKVRRQQLPLPLSPDIDPFYSSGVVRKIGPDGYKFRNEIYRQFLTDYFHPGRVGHLLSMFGRWDQAIDYLETSIAKGDTQYRTDLLAATVNSIYASSNINQAAEYLARGLVAGFNAKEAHIWYCTRGGKTLKLVGLSGNVKKDKLTIGLETPISDDRLVARSFQQVLPLRGQESDRNVEWAIPLQASDRRSVGVAYIVFQAPKWDAGTQREWELELTGYLRQAERAIYAVDSRLEEEQRREELAETLREVTVLINESLELREVLGLILQQMNRVLPFDMASVQLLNIGGNALEIIASQGFNDPKSVEELSFPLDDTYPNVQVFHHRLPIRYADVSDFFPHFVDTKFLSTQIRGWLGVPLLIGEKVIGVITLDSFVKNAYTLEHEHLAMAFAGQAAVAIENARAYAKEQEAKDFLNRLINSSLDGIIAVDDKGYITVFNEGAEQILGYSRHEILNNRKQASELYGSAEIGREIVQRLISQEKLTDYETTIIGRGGEKIPIVLSATQLQGNGGKAIGSVSFFKDLRPLRTALETSKLREGLLKAGREITSLQELPKILMSIAGSVRTALACDLVTLYTYEEGKGEIGYPPVVSGQVIEPHMLDALGYVTKESVVWKILGAGKPHFSIDSLHDRLMLSDKSSRESRYYSFVEREMICSSAGIPLIVGTEKLGVLFVNYRSPHPFIEQEKQDISLFATQAAIAIHNARLYEDIQKRGKYLNALYNAAKVITLGANLNRKQLLDKILELAITITSASGEKATLGTIQVIDEQTNELEFTNIYPAREYSKLQAKLGHRLPLDKAKDRIGRIGIPSRAALTRRSQLVDNVQGDSDYFVYNPDTKSELAVPLLDGDRVIGVINVESNKIGAFDSSDKSALEALADLTVAVLQNQEHIQQLSRANTVAMMGAWGADVVHDVKREVGAIRRTVFLLQRDFDLAPDAREKVKDLDRYANALVLPTLPQQSAESSEGFIGDVSLIDNVAQEEVHEWQQLHSDITIRFKGHCDGLQVAMHEQWVRRLLRHFIRNAIKSIPPENSSRKVIVHTNKLNGRVEVSVEDNGQGVAQELLPKLFVEPIIRENGREGQGLLLVGFLAKQHGGKADIKWNRPGSGACFYFTIPIA